MSFRLSYIVATRNRLPFLKITLERLIAELQTDEEIVVVDGNSTDGTKPYLQKLFETGKIQQFISEPDKNQAHAWNKAMLMAKGTLIKKVIDDDVLSYNSVRKCKHYMLQNPSVDVVISNDLSSNLYNHQSIEKHTRLPQFENWRTGLAPSFTFRDVHMLIRKSTLTYIGLYNPVFIMMDWEYALRISYLKANITYYTGYNALSVAHPGTVTSLKDQALIVKQGERALALYEYAGDDADTSYWSKIKIAVGKLVYKQDTTKLVPMGPAEIEAIYSHYYDNLNEINNAGSFSFLNSLDIE